MNLSVANNTPSSPLVRLPFSIVKPGVSDIVTADFYGPVFHESYRRPTVANASDNALSDGCQDTVCGYIRHIYAVKLLFRARERDVRVLVMDSFRVDPTV